MMFENGLHLAEEQFKNFVAGYNYNKNLNGKRIKVGVLYTYGTDSSVLLDIASKFKDTMNYELHILYLSYADFSRAKDADDIALKKAEEYGCKITMQVCNTKAHSVMFPDNVHEVYSDLIFKSEDIDLILLPDTTDTMVETFLLRLLNGTNPNGLRGSTFLTTYDNNGIKRDVGRPFLCIERSVVLDYARYNPVEFLTCEELHNMESLDLTYIRNNIMPMINHRFNLRGFIESITGVRKLVDEASAPNLSINILSGEWKLNDFINLSPGNRLFVIREYFKKVHDIDLTGDVLQNLNQALQGDITSLSVRIGDSRFMLLRDDEYIRVFNPDPVTVKV